MNGETRAVSSTIMRVLHVQMGAPLLCAVVLSVLCVLIAAAWRLAWWPAWWWRRRRVLCKAMQERFYLSQQGFLMGAPVASLPHKFAAWEAIAHRLHELNRDEQLCAELERLPLLSVAPGELDDAMLRRARVLLTLLVHSFVHGRLVPWRQLQPLPLDGRDADHLAAEHGTTVPRYKYEPPPLASAPANAEAAGGRQGVPELPEQLATPWRQVSALLRMPLVMTVTDSDLWNAAPGLDHLPAAEWIPRFRQLFSMTATPRVGGL